VSVFGLTAAPAARADGRNKKTVVTFSQAVEVAGHMLPAGTYTFQLADSPSDRHVVQIFTADGRRMIATVLAIPDYRLRPTDDTVIQFREVSAGSPQAIRAWFYPGDTSGQEFVIRSRARCSSRRPPTPSFPRSPPTSSSTMSPR
jgi:hypothetical protein